MGEDEARAAGSNHACRSIDGVMRVLRARAKRRPASIACDDFVLTTPDDTSRRRAICRRRRGPHLAGGDGTAQHLPRRRQPPVIGVPAGVKIHRRARPRGGRRRRGRAYLRAPCRRQLREGEVMDIDEEAFRANRVSAHLYGYMTVPYARGLTQSAKAGSVAGEERALNDIATEVIAGMEPGALYILGPGTTTRTGMERLGLPKTLLGVDAVGTDPRRRRPHRGERLLALVAAGRRPSSWSPSSAAGHILRRGNQQISPAVIRAVGPATSSSSATQTKLLSLEAGPLLVDTGRPDSDRQLVRLRLAKVGTPHLASAPHVQRWE
jgi:predicted polyphosphate/ATP-dependent NAD kinase